MTTVVSEVVGHEERKKRNEWNDEKRQLKLAGRIQPNQTAE
jgi:hypothetical protein